MFRHELLDNQPKLPSHSLVFKCSRSLTSLGIRLTAKTTKILSVSLIYFCIGIVLSACVQTEVLAPPSSSGACPPRRVKVTKIIEETREGLIKVGGGNIWYKMTGIGKPGLPLLVIQGGPWSSHEYLENLEYFSNYRPVIFYNQLGSGRSEKPEDKTLWSLERYVLELRELLESLKIPKVHILAQSFGSFVALDFALQNPEKVASLAFPSPVLSAGRYAADAQSWVDQMPVKYRKIIEKASNSGDFSTDAYKEAVELYRHKHFCRLNPWPESLSHTVQNSNIEMFEYLWGPSNFQAKGIWKDLERISELSKIQLPVLLSCGEFDEVPPRTCAFYSSLIPTVEVMALGEASNQHHLEKESSYFLAFGRFLRKADRIARDKCNTSATAIAGH